MCEIAAVDRILNIRAQTGETDLMIIGRLSPLGVYMQN
jgi:hypothetical protein